MFFSVIVTAYNRADILKQSLDAIENQSMDKRDYEVIIVDDGSTDNTKSLVSTYTKRLKNFRYFYQENQGQGIARNYALEKAKGKVIVFIQDDIIVTHDFLYEHQKFHYFHTEEDAGVLGFTAWHPKLKLNNCMKWMTNGSSLMGRFGGHQFAYEKLRGKTLANYNFFYTSNLSIKKSILDKYPFDPVFSGYGWEDIELGYRLQKKANFKLYYNSWAVAYHYHHMDEADLIKRMINVGKSARVFHKKYPELNKVPGLMKLIVLQLLSNPILIFFLKALKDITGEKIYSFYYYCLSKKYFLKGLRLSKS